MVSPFKRAFTADMQNAKRSRTFSVDPGSFEARFDMMRLNVEELGRTISMKTTESLNYAQEVKQQAKTIELLQQEISQYREKHLIEAERTGALEHELGALKCSMATQIGHMWEEEKVKQAQVEDQMTLLTTSLTLVTSERDQKDKECSIIKSKLKSLQTSLQIAEQQLRIERMSSDEKGILINNLQSSALATDLRLQHLEERVVCLESVRRRLHNEVQELKGNIRVYCRLRPFLPRESANEQAHLKITSDCKIEVHEARGSADGMRTDSLVYPFTFDKVFDPLATQVIIFSEISQLVQSALDGYNVCIFAYGQTGSGKTYTMEGIVDDIESLGMIPRAVEQIFNAIETLKQKGWTYEVKGQFLEIYNEQIRDLLSTEVSEQKHEIRHTQNPDSTTVTSITSMLLVSAQQALVMLQQAAKKRAVGATLINERSSRSHSVFTLTLKGKNKNTSEEIESRVNLIDLAGSERLGQSGATGDRLRETQHINKSLSSLGDVIQALANKNPTVPFRNSKLTFLLKNSLSGNSKALMFVTISPVPANANETLSSLRFAAKVNTCQIGTARKQTRF